MPRPHCAYWQHGRGWSQAETTTRSPLLEVHHTRLLNVIANFATADPVADSPETGQSRRRVRWVLSPIDLIPEFLPVIGPLDDIVVVALALRYAARRIPPQALIDAWPAERRILERLAPATATSPTHDKDI